jgi:dipeptide/tripeptide permease
MDATRAPTGLVAQIRSFDAIFWICIFMELMERMAYYGVRLVVPVYMVLSTSDGGPGLTHSEKGTILACWAAMQSWLPTFAGGFSDRFGYKRTIAVSVLLKTAGYAGMALAGDFWTMFIGTQLLAAGTGLFKPGIQGTMAHSIAKAPGSDSMGWGLFYQSVNVGAAISAYIPMFTRDVYGWNSVFWACSAIVLSNLVPLFFYDDPVDERPGGRDDRDALTLVRESLRELFTSPVLLGFILISAGFWFSFHQLFDMLPNYVDDWTDSSLLLRDVGAAFGWESWTEAAARGEKIPQERLLNTNALMIMLTMFVFAWLSSKMRVLTSTIVGMTILTVAISFFAMSANVYLVLAGIVTYTIGEMLASPKRQEYMASLAPPGKRALYLGYANMPDGIGWVLGSLVAGDAYEHRGDKINLCRTFLAEQADAADLELFTRKMSEWPAEVQAEAAKAIVERLNLPAQTSSSAAVDALVRSGDALQQLPTVVPRNQVFAFTTEAVPTLPSGASSTPDALREYLFATYHPGQVWWLFLGIGAASVVLMVAYDRWVRRRLASERLQPAA